MRLLWSVLHLTKTQAVNAEYERLGQPPVTLNKLQRKIGFEPERVVAAVKELLGRP